MHYRPLNLNRLQFFIDSGRLNPNAPITMYHLWRSGVTGGKIKDGVVLLGGVSSSTPTFLKMMHFDCSRISRILFLLSSESSSLSKNYNWYIFTRANSTIKRELVRHLIAAKELRGNKLTFLHITCFFFLFVFSGSVRLGSRLKLVLRLAKHAYCNKVGLRLLLKPEKFEGKRIPRRARPNTKLMEYYTSVENRGYLADPDELEKARQLTYKLENEVDQCRMYLLLVWP